MLWLVEFYPKALSSCALTHLRSLPQARAFVAELRKRGRDVVLADLAASTSDWAYVQLNLIELLKFSDDAKVRAMRKKKLSANKASSWDEGYSFMADALLREAQNEVQEISMDW